MNPEHVKLIASEQIYGESNLLEAHASILTMIQRYQEFKKLRKEELFLKIELKRLLGETEEHLNTCSRNLPESRFYEEEKEKEKMKQELVEKMSKDKKQENIKERNLSIEQELAQIHKKLERLQHSQ